MFVSPIVLIKRCLGSQRVRETFAALGVTALLSLTAIYAGPPGLPIAEAATRQSGSIPVGTTPTSSSFALGIHLAGPTAASFWNTHALPSDSAYAIPTKVDLLSQSTAGRKVMYLQGTNLPQLLALAKNYGISMVEFNYEKIHNCGTLVAGEQTAYQAVRQSGLTFVFSPTGRMLLRCYQQYPQIVQNTDIIIFQTEFLQGTDPNYFQTVKAVIHGLRQMRNIPVWVQVSVSPQSSPTLDAQTVIDTISQLEDGQGDNPDEVHVFYRPATRPVMEQVIRAFRSPHS